MNRKGLLTSLIFLAGFVSCSSATRLSNLPNISSFESTPSSQFFIANDDLNRIHSTHPFKGQNSGCAHAGAHVAFSNEDTPYQVNIYAPVDGYIANIDTCFDLGDADRFGLGIVFAKTDNDEPVEFYFSIEPAEQHRCLSNPTFYDQYVLVEDGQTVSAGDLIAIYPKFADQETSGPHIHFHLADTSEHYCPNIFSDSVKETFGSLYNDETCDDEPFGEDTFCFAASDSERLLAD